MPIQIEINDEHIEALIEFYIQRIKVLRNEISEREKETKEINTQILKLKKGKNIGSSSFSTSTSTKPLANYSDKWPWVKKIRFALDLEGRPLTTKEIVDILIDYEISLMFDRKKAVASISSMLSTKSGPDKEFLRIESESGDFAYDINKSNTINEFNDNDVSPFD